MFDLVSLLDGPGCPFDQPALVRWNEATKRVGVHRFCQTTNVLRRDDELEVLIEKLTGIELVELPEATVCCGFGGASSVKAPEVAEAIVRRKLACVDDARIDLLITDNPGCILHLRAAVAAAGNGPEVMHVAEFLERCNRAEDVGSGFR